MGYHVIDPDVLEPTPDRPCDRRSISEAVDLEQMALNVYEVEPGEQIPLAYHVHDEQEEVFHVLAGRLHVETPEDTYEVDAGECFVAEPASPHRAHNPENADGAVRVLAVGAPAVDDVSPYEPDE